MTEGGKTEISARGRVTVFQRIRERGLFWILAHFSLQLWDKLFDYVMYPASQIYFGPIVGTAMMTVASLIVCLALLLLYDHLGVRNIRDVLGFESIKEAATAASEKLEQSPILNGLRTRTSLARRTLVFLYVSIWFDPMTCAIFMRPANSYTMGGKDWALFFASVVVSNGVWALTVFVGWKTIMAIIGLR